MSFEIISASRERQFNMLHVHCKPAKITMLLFSM